MNKKTYIAIPILISLLCSYKANATVSSLGCVSQSSSTGGFIVIGQPHNCTSQETEYWGNGGRFAVNNCTSCMMGFQINELSISTEECGTIPYKICGDISSYGCYGSWQDQIVYIDEHIAEITQTYNSPQNKCTITVKDLCAANYYGSPTFSSNGSISGCNTCPKGENSSSYSQSGSTDITDCYVTNGSDNSGNYVYTEKCYYTK